MRNRVLPVIVLLVLAASALGCGLLAAPQSSTNVVRAVWGGAYTTEQAERGKVEYERVCTRCHAANFDGVMDATILGDFAPRISIRGNDFMERWRENTVYGLFTYIKSGMPPRTDPRSSVPNWSDSTYADVVAYLLQGNGFPAGSRELAPADMRGIRIQEKDGPKPLPSFSMVQITGCMKQLTPGVWELSPAGTPIRIRELEPPTDEELAVSADEPLGNYEYDLQNIGVLGSQFVAVDHEGHKMQARGVLIRQPPNVRIDVQSFVDVAETCG
jgi:cytochrome c5